MIERLSSEAPADRAALLVKVARLYHEQGVRQPDIADRLHMSQSRVSRLLKEAVDVGIVRTVVVPPPGSVRVIVTFERFASGVGLPPRVRMSIRRSPGRIGKASGCATPPSR